ncbi:DUF1294 domain-containing protein [Endozoicomonas ascidiicola]|uniref:DUF1294 domain-containing protein n=1 Tax=Endozoicomonas ascidiicola TaxID=1698521 RepID=UPI000830B4E2|nr:DUF1294 domain-containing protein [Endozoicomonas ascidiicola]
MDLKGTIVNWNESKGFGFIKPEDSKSTVFAHISDVKGRRSNNMMGTEVTFGISKDDKGRMHAIDIKAIKSATQWPVFSLAYIPLLAFLIAVGLPIYRNEYPIEVAYWIGALSLISFYYYGRDKSKAQSNQWRVNEDKLHLLSILGGWPGAIIAQKKFRHKTAKKSFQRVFWTSVVINCGIIAWTFTYSGAPYMYDAIFTIKYHLVNVAGELTPLIKELLR